MTLTIICGGPIAFLPTGGFIRWAFKDMHASTNTLASGPYSAHSPGLIS